jgi:hypothetical protein
LISNAPGLAHAGFWMDEVPEFGGDRLVVSPDGAGALRGYEGIWQGELAASQG